MLTRRTFGRLGLALVTGGALGRGTSAVAEWRENTTPPAATLWRVLLVTPGRPAALVELPQITPILMSRPRLNPDGTWEHDEYRLRAASRHVATADFMRTVKHT